MKKKLTIIALFTCFIGFSQTGINTQRPTATLDVNGDLRVRNIPLTNVSTENVVIADSLGNMKKTSLSNIISNVNSYSPLLAGIFRLVNNINCPCDKKVIVYDEIVRLNSDLIEYNGTTGSFTIKEDGLYQIQMQTGIGNNTVNDDIVYGVLNASNQWIGRATSSYAKGNGARFFSYYSTTLYLTANQVIKMGVYLQSGLIQGIQTGGTGNGNVTNLTIVKY